MTDIKLRKTETGSRILDKDFKGDFFRLILWKCVVGKFDEKLIKEENNVVAFNRLS